MSERHAFERRIVIPTAKIALLSVKLMFKRLKQISARTFGAKIERTALQRDLISRRPCPECGGPMAYHPMRWSALTGRYLRACQSCGYTDSHPVKIVRQL